MRSVRPRPSRFAHLNVRDNRIKGARLQFVEAIHPIHSGDDLVTCGFQKCVFPGCGWQWSSSTSRMLSCFWGERGSGSAIFRIRHQGRGMPPDGAPTESNPGGSGTMHTSPVPRMVAPEMLRTRFTELALGLEHHILLVDQGSPQKIPSLSGPACRMMQERRLLPWRWSVSRWGSSSRSDNPGHGNGGGRHTRWCCALQW